MTPRYPAGPWPRDCPPRTLPNWVSPAAVRSSSRCRRPSGPRGRRRARFAQPFRRGEEPRGDGSERGEETFRDGCAARVEERLPRILRPQVFERNEFCRGIRDQRFRHVPDLAGGEPEDVVLGRRRIRRLRSVQVLLAGQAEQRGDRAAPAYGLVVEREEGAVRLLLHEQHIEDADLLVRLQDVQLLSDPPHELGAGTDRDRQQPHRTGQIHAGGSLETDRLSIEPQTVRCRVTRQG
ncbi:hypothetical protein GCM10010129_06420 [Streptomyces fumigatiscleroticus]|nr:hypothetical protein GCM10010129_06420 [Streptomyces fumigatiscleroticus]